MLFEEYRKRRWKSKLKEAIEEASVIIELINKGKYLFIGDMSDRLIDAKRRVGKYNGLLELNEKEYERKIKEILDK